MKNRIFQLAAAALLAVAASTVNADAIIDNGTIKLGVDDLGQLNINGGIPSAGVGTTVVGLRLITATGGELESTSPGCLCEGWGVGVDDGMAATNGWANNSSGNSNISIGAPQTTDGTSSTTVANIGSALRVTHEYNPSPDTPFLYEVTVTIENVSGGTLGDTTAGSRDLRYRRVMDWDAEPTAFSEFVTIAGNGADNLLRTSDDGFDPSNPFSTPSDLAGCGISVDFTDCGPADHGAVFDFGFEGLEDGESRELTIFYGAAPTERDADLARALAGVEVYSYGQCNTCSTSGAPVTFIFGFAGVGGTPAPAAWNPGTYHFGSVRIRLSGCGTRTSPEESLGLAVPV